MKYKGELDWFEAYPKPTRNFCLKKIPFPEDSVIENKIDKYTKGLARMSHAKFGGVAFCVFKS